MKFRGSCSDSVAAGGNISGKETIRDERIQVIALRDKVQLTWKVK